jgi:hypothetical protein
MLFGLQILWRYNREATLERLAFLANSARGGPSHTVLITDIPGMRCVRQYGSCRVRSMPLPQLAISACLKLHMISPAEPR